MIPHRLRLGKPRKSSSDNFRLGKPGKARLGHSNYPEKNGDSPHNFGAIYYNIFLKGIVRVQVLLPILVGHELLDRDPKESAPGTFIPSQMVQDFGFSGILLEGLEGKQR